MPSRVGVSVSRATDGGRRAGDEMRPPPLHQLGGWSSFRAGRGGGAPARWGGFVDAGKGEVSSVHHVQFFIIVLLSLQKM